MMAAMFQDGGLTYLNRSSSLLQIDHLAENIKYKKIQIKNTETTLHGYYTMINLIYCTYYIR